MEWLEAAPLELSHGRSDKLLTTRAMEIDTVLLDTLVQVLGK